ncbi:MAG: glycoside hydrolase family 97 protein [Paludibacteraceae bacterium]|nr:glycoside hydrolase family 97 protein [Paludibacteraceae bacterium]
MKKSLLLFASLLLATAVWGFEIKSPSENIVVNFTLDGKGTPTYSVSYKGKAVIEPSSMGFKFADGKDYSNWFTIVKVDTTSFNESWKPVWGEVSTIVDNHNELTALLRHVPTNTFMTIRFRVFDDCAAFRYEFDRDSNHAYIKVANEVSQFNLTGDHKTFWIPGNPDSNEYRYLTTPLSGIDASKADGNAIGTHMIVANNCIQSPVMMKSSDGLYINIFEAALSDYPAMMLTIDKNEFCFTSLLAGSAVKGVTAFLQTPCKTPWRTIIVSDKAEDILASKSILNLNEPCKIENTDFIKPFKMVGVWWEMHVPRRSTWNYADEWNLKLEGTDWNALKPNGRHGANTENVKKYIDFAADNGIDAVLVEGWNVGWEDWAGNWKEEVFDFVTPYPDFNVKEITSYAASKGVKMIMHHETSSSVTNYERRIDSAIEFMKKWGYTGVKTGYVGWIIPRGETHDGQWMVQHYDRVIKKMADAGIMIDEHEAVRPTGQCRTYPNLLACESARGNEFNAWSDGNLPEHETILPFTRLMGGPMDYTPGIFKIKMSEYYKDGNNCQVHTTLAKQLALYVTMFSPVQMAADIPENYLKHMDAFQFIKDVAVDWDDTKVLEAEPGDYITIARKAKGSDKWFIGAITDENRRTTEIKLDFLDKGRKYIATIYADGKDADWESNPVSYSITTKKVTSKSVLKLTLANGGGCAISIFPIK